MHTMLRVTMCDVMAANDAITEGRLESVVKKVSELIKPESTFFYSDEGYRAALFLFDMTEATLIPQIAEPFFSELNAKVEFFPGMNPAELGKGLEAWKKQAPTSRSLS
jgi:hypothetical protein